MRPDGTRQSEANVSALIETTEDGFLDSRLVIRQPRKGFRSGLEAVLLAAAVPVRSGERIVEAGTGAGVAALCLAHREPAARVTGIEIEPEVAALAAANACGNGLSDQVRVVWGDIQDDASMGLEGLARGGFDHAIANPPFFATGHVRVPGDAGRARALIEGEGTLGVWIDFCLDMVRVRGTVTFVHRTERLADLLALLEGRAGGITVFPLWPAAGKPAKLVLVQARKGGGPPLRLLPGLVLHDEAGRQTGEADDILRGAAPLLL